MATERKLRTQSCRMKNHYETWERAEAARVRLQEKYGWLMKAYRCRQCDGIHLMRRKVQGKPIPIVGARRQDGEFKMLDANRGWRRP